MTNVCECILRLLGGARIEVERARKGGSVICSELSSTALQVVLQVDELAVHPHSVKLEKTRVESSFSNVPLDTFGGVLLSQFLHHTNKGIRVLVPGRPMTVQRTNSI